MYLWDNFYLLYWQCLDIFSFIYPCDILEAPPEVSSPQSYTHQGRGSQRKFGEDHWELVDQITSRANVHCIFENLLCVCTLFFAKSFACVISFEPHNSTSKTGTIISIPILQWKKLRFRFCKWLAQGHTSTAQQHWDLNTVLLGSESPIFLSTMLIFSKNISDFLLPLFLCLEKPSCPIFQILSLVQSLRPSAKGVLLGRFLLVERETGFIQTPGTAPPPDTA